MSDFEFMNEPDPQPPAALPPDSPPPVTPSYPQPSYPQQPYPTSPYPQPPMGQPTTPYPFYPQPPYPQSPYSQPYAPPYQPSFGQPPFATAPVSPQMAVAPEQPRSRRRTWIASLAALLLVALIGAAFAGIILLRHGSGQGPTQAQSLLDQAANSGLHDTTFTIAMNENVNSGATGSNNGDFSLAASGSGAIIVKPLAMDTTLNSVTSSGLPSTSSFSEEVILIGSDMYIKLGGSTLTPAGKPWIKVSLAGLPGASASGMGGGLGSTNFLDYHALHNPVLIGSEQVNGHATWHLRATMSATDNGLSPSAQATVTATYKQLGITQSDITEDMWILQDSSYPAKIVIHEGIATKSVISESTTPSQVVLDETLTFTKWNSGVSITPPPANQVTDESSLFAPTPATHS